MKDALTIVYSSLIQNQIELTSTLQSLIAEATLRGVPAVHINELRKRMESFDSRLNALSTKLLERCDTNADCENSPQAAASRTRR